MLMNTGEEGGYLWTFCFQARHPALPPSAPQREGTERDRGAGGVHVGPTKHPSVWRASPEVNVPPTLCQTYQGAPGGASACKR